MTRSERRNDRGGTPFVEDGARRSVTFVTFASFGPPDPISLPEKGVETWTQAGFRQPRHTPVNGGFGRFRSRLCSKSLSGRTYQSRRARLSFANSMQKVTTPSAAKASKVAQGASQMIRAAARASCTSEGPINRQSSQSSTPRMMNGISETRRGRP